MDNDPRPDLTDGILNYCRECRLMLEETRVLGAAIEREPVALGDESTCEALLSLHLRWAKHILRTKHQPVREWVKAMLNGSLAMMRRSHPDLFAELEKIREQKRKEYAELAPMRRESDQI